MTDSQFELFLMHGGMMSEGLKSNEALAFIVRSELATPEDVAWLVEKNAYSAAAAKVAKEKFDGQRKEARTYCITKESKP